MLSYATPTSVPTTGTGINVIPALWDGQLPKVQKGLPAADPAANTEAVCLYRTGLSIISLGEELERVAFFGNDRLEGGQTEAAQRETPKWVLRDPTIVMAWGTGACCVDFRPHGTTAPRIDTLDTHRSTVLRVRERL